MEEKYARLLLERCLDLKNTSYLYIYYPKEIREFLPMIEKVAQELSVSVVKEEEDSQKLREELEKTPYEEIAKNPMFSHASWDKVAQENGAMLFLETVLPDAFDGVDSKKFEEFIRVRRESKPLYNQKLDDGTLTWCIASYPSTYWANKLFSNEEHAFQKLWATLLKTCMVDQENPTQAWDLELQKAVLKTEYLNQLDIQSFHYHNAKGTDFTVELPLHYQFCSAATKNTYGVDVIVNMPSYEVFTSPKYQSTQGIIYSSKPLFYQGRKIDQFYLRFEHGKVVEYHAEVGETILKGILEGEQTASYLGEVAFVDYHSPISDTGLVFETTLLDENASCHVAIGAGFAEALSGGLEMTEEQRYQAGINNGKTHVDFMIGTEDLEIEAVTRTGEIVPIFHQGNFIFSKK